VVSIHLTTNSVLWSSRGIELHHEPPAVVGRIQAAMDHVAEAYRWGKPQRRHDPAQPERSWFSVQPMGGCRVASDASRGVVDFRGEVFGRPGFRVADASVFASAPATAPSLSIAAFSSRIAERIAAEAGRAGG